MTGAGSGGGGGYDYVEASFPSDADEGESLYHLTENAAFVYSGTDWIEQTVTDHSQLSGVNEGDHRSDSRVSDLAPVQSVNGETGDISVYTLTDPVSRYKETSYVGNYSTYEVTYDFDNPDQAYDQEVKIQGAGMATVSVNGAEVSDGYEDVGDVTFPFDTGTGVATVKIDTQSVDDGDYTVDLRSAELKDLVVK